MSCYQTLGSSSTLTGQAMEGKCPPHPIMPKMTSRVRLNSKEQHLLLMKDQSSWSHSSWRADVQPKIELKYTFLFILNQ